MVVSISKKLSPSTNVVGSDKNSKSESYKQLGKELVELHDQYGKGFEKTDSKVKGFFSEKKVGPASSNKKIESDTIDSLSFDQKLTLGNIIMNLDRKEDDNLRKSIEVCLKTGSTEDAEDLLQDVRLNYLATLNNKVTEFDRRSKSIDTNENSQDDFDHRQWGLYAKVYQSNLISAIEVTKDLFDKPIGSLEYLYSLLK